MYNISIHHHLLLYFLNHGIEVCNNSVLWVQYQNNTCTINLIKSSQAVKKGAAPKKAMVKKDVKSKVAAKKWL